MRSASLNSRVRVGTLAFRNYGHPFHTVKSSGASVSTHRQLFISTLNKPVRELSLFTIHVADGAGGRKSMAIPQECDFDGSPRLQCLAEDDDVAVAAAGGAAGGGGGAVVCEDADVHGMV